jgi:hypothetical protein
MRRREFFSVIGGAAIAALAIVLLPVAAYAQSNPSLTTSRDQRSGYRSLRTVKPTYVDEASYKRNKSYEDALKSIPDSKIELDPWKDAR